ncbi:MAG TPA: VWA domain-containing protein [Polyangiaceae bacterium]|nr:VWA domain-containing protein [Polyangiaceae bacterium]
MSFVVVAALAITAFVAAPFLAHLLRRGRARELVFPPAAWVPAARSVARQRARLEDRFLFLLRALLIATLALLGATPLLRCSRLALDRSGGASVALALVLDDSQSMRARLPDGGTRFERARNAALELVGTARSGDAVTVVLAGKPARIALAATRDLAAARRTLQELRVTDRGTELGGAVKLAQSMLASLPQRDRKLALLSDFAGEIGDEARELWVPLPELAARTENCGIASAESDGHGVSVQVACTSMRAAQGRTVSLVAGEPSGAAASAAPAAATEALQARPGLQTLRFGAAPAQARRVKLSGEDAISEDNEGAIRRGSSALGIGVWTQAQEAHADAFGPGLVESALEALGSDLRVRPLAVLPEEPKELASFAGLVLDDPNGLGPEVRDGIETWLKRGGVALALLGPSAESRSIGATLEPFAQGGLPWEKTRAKGVDAASIAWLGPEASALAELAPQGRVHLAGEASVESRVAARFDDGAPFLLEREFGLGLVWTLALPSSPELSDFALRPGFLALLDQFVEAAHERASSASSVPGVPFRFAAGSQAEVSDPSGKRLSSEALSTDPRRQLFTPELAGVYRVRTHEGTEERVVSLDASELLTEPALPPTQALSRSAGVGVREVDVSGQVVWVLLAWTALELALRLLREMAQRRASPTA